MKIIKTKFEIVSLYEEVFDQILRNDGYHWTDLIKSLDAIDNNEQVFQAGEGAGASGSFFFFSKDRKFIIKTVKEDEMKLIKKFVHRYKDYLIVENPNSILVRIYGIFQIKSQRFTNMHVMIMQNMYRESDNVQSSLMFDLKGSRIGRKSASKQSLAKV